MSNAHRMWSIALGLFVMAAGSHVFLGASGVSGASRETRIEPAGVESPRLVAKVATAWVSPTEARRDIERRTLEVDRVARLYGGAARVVDTRVLMRLRTPSGARLEEPLAHFERSVEILGSEASGNAVGLRLALKELDVSAQSAPVDQLALRPNTLHATSRIESNPGF